MKKISLTLLVGICLLGSYNPAKAQILKKLEKKAEKVINQKIDTALDNNPKETGKEETDPGKTNSTGPFKEMPQVAYDFKAGSEVVFFDDFSEDAIGAMAKHWTSNGRGSVTNVSGFEGKWLKMEDKNTYKIKDLVRIPENFTLEFDLLAIADNTDGISVEFGFDHQKGISKHYYLGDRNPINIDASYRFNKFDFTSNELSQRKSSEVKADMSYFVNDVMKVKLRIRGDRMETYINEYKVLDTEMVNPNTKKYFYIAVNYGKNNAEIYMDNVRITQL